MINTAENDYACLQLSPAGRIHNNTLVEEELTNHAADLICK